MKFTEAKRILAEFEGGPPLAFLLGMSGQPELLLTYLAAAAAERGHEARVRTLPFNTLAQLLHGPKAEGEREVFVLLPWDLLPVTDWRSGVPAETRDPSDLIAEARGTLERIRARQRPAMLYVDAPIPEVLPDHHAASALAHHLRAAAVEAGCTLLPADTASLEDLLRSGSPFAAAALGRVARAVVAAALDPAPPPAKVLVTDFDNTLWRGVVGEDGVEGLHFGPEGLGYPHFIYQTFLLRLRREGTLLAGVTKNDPDLARAPLARPGSVLSPDDFVTILASYNAKSAQIRELAAQLNLGLDSFVFVDDNPVELAEVARAIPEVHLVEFPSAARELPGVLTRLSRLFHRERVTQEDRERTELYRRRLAGMVPTDVEGADLSAFLAGLGMRLEIHDRSTRERERAVQLINKTNQFNLNGLRRADEEVGALLAGGGRLYTASLSDRHGSHGEILSFLIDADDVVRSFVLSCRVFQRRVEQAFLAWLAGTLPRPVRLEFAETERNEPFRRFLEGPGVETAEGGPTLDLPRFAEAHAADLDLFELVTPAEGASAG